MSVLSSLKEQFSSRFTQFWELEEILLIIKNPDKTNFTKLKIDLFEWLNIDNLEMELVEFQSSSIWKQKFISLRASLEERERDRLHGSIIKMKNCCLLGIAFLKRLVLSKDS